MPKLRKKPKAVPQRSSRGQFLILSVLIIIILMISFVSLLASTSVLRISMNRTDFREVTQEVTSNFRSAVAAAMAEVSKTLDFKASVTQYTNYTILNGSVGQDSLLEWQKTILGRGYQFVSDWQANVLQRYPGLGLNLSYTQPIFQCGWNSSTGYSEVSSNMSLDILTYGFYGWTSKVTVRLKVTILDLYAAKTDGKTVAFHFSLLKENDVPVTGLAADTVSMLYQYAGSDKFTVSKSVNLTYLGSGHYLAEFYMYSTTVQEGLNEIKEFATENMSASDFKGGYNAAVFCARIDFVSAEYNASRFIEAYGNLTEARSWIVVHGEEEETNYILALIDRVGSQILPTVRVALQDSRGIIVGAFRIYSDVKGGYPFKEDNIGPITRDLTVSPNPTQGASSVTLSAWIDDTTTGLSNINASEYFIAPPSQNGAGRPIPASDGSFNSPVEKVETQIDISGWAQGSHIIYVHGQDKAGNWGGFSNITVTVTRLTEMYVDSIEWYLLPWYRFPFPGWRWYRLEAVVKIVDINGTPVSRAWVYGHWDGQPRIERRMTDRDGEASFSSDPFRGSRTFTFTVDNVTRTGYIYNPKLNKETSDRWP